jgi:hypothetical protein
MGHFNTPAMFRTVVFLLASLAASPDLAAAQTPSPVEWTVIVYLDADNDLEAPQMHDLREMLKVGSSAAVNIVVLADRHAEGAGKYSNDAVANLANWTGAKLLRVETGRLQELADWGEANMGDPATLSRLLATAQRDFPARKYALIFGDHGMSWPGVAVDETSGGDMLTTLEIASVLQESFAVNGKLELVGFDACVMASLEVASAVAPFAHYLVASEEIEPSEGWDYTAWLTALNGAANADGVALGRIIVDTYRESFANNDQGKGVTLSVIDLAKVAPLQRAVEVLAAAAKTQLTKSGREAWVSLARARSDTEEFGRSTGARPGSLGYDLQGFARNVAKQIQVSEVQRAAGSVQAAVRDAVRYEIHGQARPNASGMSIFFPPDLGQLIARGETSYDETSFAQSNRWFPFLKDYLALESGDTEEPKISPVISDSRSVANGASAKITARLSDNDIDSASFIVAIANGEKRIVIGSLPVEVSATGDLTEDWDGDWFAISDGEEEFVCPITDFQELNDENDVYWAAVPAQVRIQGRGVWIDVTLNFLLDFSGEDPTGDLVYAVEQGVHGPREIDLTAGDLLRPIYLSIDRDGAESLVPADDEEKVLRLDRPDDIKVEAMRLPKGRYEVGFLVEDLAGNTAEQLTEITIP